MSKKRYHLYDGQHPLDFEKRRHIYSDGSGHQVANATGVLKMLNKPKLASWYGRITAEGFAAQMEPGVSYDELEILAMTKEAKETPNKYSGGRMDAGTLAHDWMEDFVNWKIKGEKGPTPKPVEKIANPNIRKSVEGFLGWHERTQPEYIFAERPCYSVEHQYCGKVDAIAIIKDRLHVIDFKTGKGVWAEAGIQVAAYLAAILEEMPHLASCKERARRLILHLPAFEGNPKAWEEEDIEKRLTGYSWERDAEIFTALLDLYYWAWNGPNRWVFFGKSRP